MKAIIIKDVGTDETSVVRNDGYYFSLLCFYGICFLCCYYQLLLIDVSDFDVCRELNCIELLMGSICEIKRP